MSFREARHTSTNTATDNKIIEDRVNLFSYLLEVVDGSKTGTGDTCPSSHRGSQYSIRGQVM
jgi:hypothetical protein